MAHDESHVSSYRTYIFAWIALVILTGLTLVSAELELGRISTTVSLAIAICKATLVLLFFMHLRDESKATRTTFLVAIITLGIFLIGVFTDVFFLRNWGY